MSGRRVIISGGGTGGHLYPALVVGRKLQALDRTIELTFVGTHRDVEKKIMGEHGVSFIPMTIEGLKGRGLKSLKSLAILPLSFRQSLSILRRTKPGLVIGVGGFSSGPIVLLASWLGIPTLIMEQNAHPGFTNRLLSRWVRKAVVAFASSLPYFKGKGVCLGNPVREEFYALPAKPGTEGLSVLVFGGSQGSRFLNEKMTAALPLLSPTKDGFRITHQTGTKDLEWVAARYRASGYETRAEVVPYITDMPGAFGRADLVVSRAGATTLAELMAARKAAVLVPFAGAAEDHQTRNARELEALGGAEVIPEIRLTPEALAGRLFHYLNSPADIRAMEKNLAALGIENPAAKIAGLCLSLMEGHVQEQRS
jgi:UDP-N-acetylglucosamine--N-acetylmuramyl-(pentapeptide) pyrophosphoryl-undecaprenol N-acetylglucosamine transferase